MFCRLALGNLTNLEYGPDLLGVDPGFDASVAGYRLAASHQPQSN
jgi:hypothetical protein